MSYQKKNKDYEILLRCQRCDLIMMVLLKNALNWQCPLCSLGGDNVV
jgi:hypothetical protein